MFESKGTVASKAAELSAKPAYVIVCGNEKGGSGKTTTAMHIIVSLLNAGHRVASIDLDTRQKSLTRYIENRIAWIKRNHLNIAVPNHATLAKSYRDNVSEGENEEMQKLSEILQSVEKTHDFIVIDTPGHDGYLMRLAHSMADTLITPLNDSYVDFDVLGKVDPLSGEVVEISHYASMVRDARRHRRSVDNQILDWVILRNRLSSINSRNKTNLFTSLTSLSMHLGCRLAEGISERVIFRELYPIGMTALDDVDGQNGNSELSTSHLAARQEVRSLITMLRLPVDNAGRQRAQIRKKWIEEASQPIKTLKIFAH